MLRRERAMGAPQRTTPVGDWAANLKMAEAVIHTKPLLSSSLLRGKCGIQSAAGRPGIGNVQGFKVILVAFDWMHSPTDIKSGTSGEIGL